MKSVIIPCSCGMKGCTTELEIREDNENNKNILFVIHDDKHDLETFVSLSGDNLFTIFESLRTKLGKRLKV